MHAMTLPEEQSYNLVFVSMVDMHLVVGIVEVACTVGIEVEVED